MKIIKIFLNDRNHIIDVYFYSFVLSLQIKM